MRLFVGIELSEDLKAGIDRAMAALRARLDRSARGFDARWIDPRNLHITLWFLGEVSEDRVPAVTSALDSPFRIEAFDLEIAQFGAFPLSGVPRVVWLGVRRGGDHLQALNAEVGERIEPLGFEREPRPYSAHLTVARVKQARGGRALRDALAAAVVEAGSCRVDAATLFHSRLSPKGARYEPLLRIPLKECSPS
jgi:2'-5' RNA ligase